MKVVGTTEGVPAGGYQAVSDIVATHNLQFRPDESAMGVAIQLVENSTPAAPVVGDQYEFVGFISEGDVIRALDAGIDLKKAKARDIMNTVFIGVEEGTSLSCVSRMFEMGIQVLPVVQHGKVVRSITRHDLIRARLGLGPTIDA
ncbi:MAG: CBS domain-containing protein [Nitrospiraceae bacterium]